MRERERKRESLPRVLEGGTDLEALLIVDPAVAQKLHELHLLVIAPLLRHSLLLGSHSLLLGSHSLLLGNLCRVQGSGFRVQGAGCRVQGSGAT